MRSQVQIDGLDADGLATLIAQAMDERLAPLREQIERMRDAVLASQALLDVHGLASVLGVSSRSIDRYVKEGMPYRQATAGGKRLFYVPDVAEYMEKCSEGAAEPLVG